MKKSVYLEFTTSYMLQGCDYLYSGGENDPVENARLCAMEYLARDSGQVYPFVIDVSVGVGVVVSVKVFKDVRGYNDYLTREYIKNYGTSNS